jgi:hypothetical protein
VVGGDGQPSVQFPWFPAASLEGHVSAVEDESPAVLGDHANV